MSTLDLIRAKHYPPVRPVHRYTIPANAAKNWYRIAVSKQGQMHPTHCQFIMRAYNDSSNKDYYEVWWVDAEVYGRSSGLRTFGNCGTPINQVRMLYENTDASVSDENKTYLDVYLNYVLTGITNIEIEEVENVNGYNFVDDGVITESSVPSGYENRVTSVYGTGVAGCGTADYSNFSKLSYSAINANKTLGINTTYAMKVLHCTNTITLTIPAGNANSQGVFMIKNEGTGVVTLHPASTSVYIEGVSADIQLQAGEYIKLHLSTNNKYFILDDGRWKSKLAALEARVAALES